MEDETQYIEGFNAAFLLAEYEPDLLVEMAQNLEMPSTPYLEGMRDGGQQYNHERLQKFTNEFSNLRNKSKDRKLELDP